MREALERSRVAIDHEAKMQVLRERYGLLTARERQVMLLVVAGLLKSPVARPEPRQLGHCVRQRDVHC